MADQDKDKGEKIKIPERKISEKEQPVQFNQERERTSERQESLKEERIVSSELRREIETMEMDEKTRAEAEKKAQKISFLGEKEKIEHLLKIARDKGVAFAIQVAKKMNEPYLLDILHDILAREGYYQKFLK